MKLLVRLLRSRTPPPLGSRALELCGAKSVPCADAALSSRPRCVQTGSGAACAAPATTPSTCRVTSLSWPTAAASDGPGNAAVRQLQANGCCDRGEVFARLRWRCPRLDQLQVRRGGDSEEGEHAIQGAAREAWTLGTTACGKADRTGATGGQEDRHRRAEWQGWDQDLAEGTGEATSSSEEAGGA